MQNKKKVAMLVAMDMNTIDCLQHRPAQKRTTSYGSLRYWRLYLNTLICN